MNQRNNDLTLRTGIKAFKNRQYQEALPLLEKAANHGALEAQRLLSRMYFAGNGVQADRERYCYWLLRAAENGDVAAKSKIKRRYRDGELPEKLLDDPYLPRLIGNPQSK